MADDQDNGEKTEEPTQRKLQEALKKGQVANSREVASFLMLLVLALNIMWFAPFYMKGIGSFLGHFVVAPHDIPISSRDVEGLLWQVIKGVAPYLMLPLVATVLMAFLSSMLQNSIIWSGESMIPKLEKVSPLKGIKRMFSLRSLVEFLKGLIKITIVGVVSYLVIAGDMNRIEGLIGMDPMGILQFIAVLAFKIVLGACAVMAVIAVMDYTYQRYEYIKSLKMTRQELKDEFKQSEGDPQIKAKLRQIRMQRAQRRMIQMVPEADVVIRNPTHFAVALKYDAASMPAPVIVAMGQDEVALRIIDVAEAHEVPTVRNPPLARALYDTGELDEEIPLEHYQAVAEIIGYVYKLRGKKAA